MNGTNPPTFFDPRAALRDLIARLGPLNGTGHYPSVDWKQALADVEKNDRRNYAARLDARIPAHAVVLVDFRLVGTCPKLVVLGAGFHLVADQTRNAIAVRAYHLRDEARIRRNNLAAVHRYQDKNRERINSARRAKRAAIREFARMDGFRKHEERAERV